MSSPGASSQALPFTLTAAQQRVGREIARDLAGSHPMLRLVQGDVGSGKTVVAALAALQAVEAGQQVALMAPTELLAEQHLANFARWLEPLGVTVGALTGRQKAAERRAALAAAAEGSLRVAVGTHALFQGGVAFAALGLVVIDEQHRFGVHQRLALREKGAADGRVPHQLVMTATPIPRTLAMTAYADLDLSVIDELPPGRTPIRTVTVSDTRRDEVVERVREACRSGRQAYWVCTLIEESEALQCQAAEDTAALLAGALPDLRVGLVHGRQRPAEKEAAMASFKSRRDRPAGGDHGDRGGRRRAQRQPHGDREHGTAGAGAAPPAARACRPRRGGEPLRAALPRPAGRGGAAAPGGAARHHRRVRDRAADLELRGPGEVLGTRQTGEMQFRIADLLRDQPMVGQVQRAADLILQRYPDRVDPLIRRWVGERSHYAGV